MSLVRAALKRFAAVFWQPMWRRRQRSLRLCETLSLGNRGFLAVIRFREEQFLVGGTNSSIALLARLPAADPYGERELEEDEPTA